MKFTSYLSLLALLGLLGSACSYYNYDDMNALSDPPAECNTAYMTYEEDIIFLFRSSCVSCHEGDNIQGGVDLSDYTQVMVSVNDSSLLRSLESKPGYTAMPPAGTSWSECNTDKVKAWIEDGAYQD